MEDDNKVISITLTSDDIQLPINVESTESLVSGDIGRELSKDKIGTTMIREVSAIEKPCFVIDLSAIDAVLPCTIVALRGMLRDEGDTFMYLKIQGSLFYVGMSLADEILNKLNIYLSSTFDNRYKLLRSVGDKFKQVKVQDAGSIRLNL